MTVTSAFESMSEAVCERAHACRETSTVPSPFFEALFGADAEQCTARVSLGTEPGKYRESVDAGRIVFDADAAVRCLDAMEAVACAEFWSDTGWSSACEQVFVGQVANGSACTLDDDCADAASSCDAERHICDVP